MCHVIERTTETAVLASLCPLNGSHQVRYISHYSIVSQSS